MKYIITKQRFSPSGSVGNIIEGGSVRIGRGSNVMNYNSGEITTGSGRGIYFSNKKIVNFEFIGGVKDALS